MDIHKILVPLDGSSFAEQILPYAVKLAQLTRSELLLLEVAKSGEIALNQITSQMRAIDKAQVYLDSVSKLLTNPANPLHLEKGKVQVMVTPDKRMYEIPEIAARENADLIMMTTHGRSGLLRLALGSAAASIIHHSGLPVILLRSKQSQQYQPLSMLLTNRAETNEPIVIAFDGGPEKELVLEPALAIARLTDAPVHLLHVIEYYTPGIYVEPVDVNKQWVETKAFLAPIQEELEAFGISCKTVILEGELGEQTTEYANKIKAQLVVLATDSHAFASNQLLGSVALDVIQYSNEPIMLINLSRYKSSQTARTENAKTLVF